MNSSIVRFFVEDIAFTPPAIAIITPWVQQVVQQANHTLGPLSFIFCSDRYLHEKNVQYLQHDTLTDVITFDYAEEPKTVTGDIYISVERVRENAVTYQLSFEQELSTVMIHGVLHLLGYSDKTPEEQAIMQAQESACVALLRTLV
ncbi:MAG: rRNA maturation RNase YbeY [Bacteroidota bacterium]